jgi:hypothetical protein
MMKRLSGWIGCGLVAFVLGACASAGPRDEGSDSRRLMADEIVAENVMNLYDAIYRLRPRWLEPRAPRSAFGGAMDAGIVVFMDRTRLGGTDELRRLSPGDVSWVEYLTGSEAAARLPGIHSANVDGAIVVHMRTQEGR